MNAKYEDIISRIKEEPKWYDSNGVPRFDKFNPELCPNIYAQQVILLRISCQACNEEFLVEMNGGVFNFIENPSKLHYGDPPIHNCVGDTMNCNDLEVVEVWNKKHLDDFKRIKKLEGKIQ